MNRLEEEKWAIKCCYNLLGKVDLEEKQMQVVLAVYDTEDISS